MMADLLVAADYRGHFSHGMNRLEFYLNDIKTGALCAEAKPKILKVCFMNLSKKISKILITIQGISSYRLG